MTSDSSDTSVAGSPPSEYTNPNPNKRLSASSDDKPAKKRSNSTATTTSTTAAADGAAAASKATKRRAARACVSCRARKVRCDVVEQSPCGNCKWDNVECVVQESRRRKKHLMTAIVGQQQQQQQLQNQNQQQGSLVEAQLLRSKPTTTTTSTFENKNHHHHHNHNNNSNNRTHSHHANAQQHTHPVQISSAADLRRPSNGSAISTNDVDVAGGHVPHLIYQHSTFRNDQTLLKQAKSQPGSDTTVDGLHIPQQRQPQPQQQQQPQQQPQSWNANSNFLAQQNALFEFNRTAQFLSSLEEYNSNAQLPAFVRPLPSKIASDDVDYLHIKGALTLPNITLQNALLQAYVEYVHPYMPLMDLHEFLNIVNRRDGLNGQTSLFLYQAIMFSATAFVDIKYLRDAGYPTRKAARKAFFQKTRLLYDFDYELDRLVLVQGLMLMTYWYETPDDQKDTWHWMGVAISLAHTIGLHRNPGSTTMSIQKQKLWKRIWWSCFMRDRLIALGMRRPTRIKDEDFDVPMLEETDFEIQPLAESITVIPPGCSLMRDVTMQRELAIMCIAKAKLCVCVSHMLKAQYSVLIRDNMKPDNTTNSTMMMFPNKQLDNVESVNQVDMDLMAWAESLPTCCQYRTLTPAEIDGGKSTIAVQRTLLHMVYYTTISALHRPQFLPSSPTRTPMTSRPVQEMSRLRVRDAAMHITRMASELGHLRLERYLPTTGVTVILPAMIIHLLEMKNPLSDARDRATRGFRQCMRVMEKLREIYAAADYATGFLDAALRKAAIDVNNSNSLNPQSLSVMKPMQTAMDINAQTTPPPENAPYMTVGESLFNEKPPRENLAAKAMPPPTTTSTTAASASVSNNTNNTVNIADLDLSATSPPHTDLSSGVTPSASGGSDGAKVDMEALDLDFMQGHDEFDWNAVAGTDFDVDQWLQFPPEGVNVNEVGSGDDGGDFSSGFTTGEDIIMGNHNNNGNLQSLLT